MVNDEYVQQLEHRLMRLEGLLAEVLASQAAAPPPAPAAAPAEDEQDFAYPSLESWMQQEFTPIYTRAVGGDFKWCPRWFEHVEAVSRFEALWRAWERLRLDPVFGMATWYRDYLDLMLPGITNGRGPFARCSPERHEPVKPLPLEPAPPGYWDWPDEFADPDVTSMWPVPGGSTLSQEMAEALSYQPGAERGWGTDDEDQPTDPYRDPYATAPYTPAPAEAPQGAWDGSAEWGVDEGGQQPAQPGYSDEDVAVRENWDARARTWGQDRQPPQA